jgi:tetratricopeptide (TPR) repeat protein
LHHNESAVCTLQSTLCILRAKAGSLEFSEESIRRAIQHLEHGLQIIGDNALLYAGMTFAHAQLVNVGAGQEGLLAKAHEYVEKALALDPHCADAYIALARTVMLEADVPGMARQSKQALAIDPNNTLALATLGAAYLYSGKITAAAAVCDRLMRIDPIAFQTHWTQGALTFYEGGSRAPSNFSAPCTNGMRPRPVLRFRTRLR